MINYLGAFYGIVLIQGVAAALFHRANIAICSPFLQPSERQSRNSILTVTLNQLVTGTNHSLYWLSWRRSASSELIIYRVIDLILPILFYVRSP